MSWVPEGFEKFNERFPATPALPPVDDWTARFAAAWHGIDAPHARAQLAARGAKTTVVLVKGFMGDWMPGNFQGPLRALGEAGFDAVIAPVDTTDRADENGRRLARFLEERPCRERLVFCGHSKGGVECWLALAHAPALRARTDRVITAQTSRGASRVLESMLHGAHRQTLSGAYARAAELAQAFGVRLLGARRGASDLMAPRIHELAAQVERLRGEIATLHCASWSTTPTTWLDSYHRRLGEIRPGVAHDGQFYVEDLLWPGVPHVLLPNLDHAQPAMGGHGFDAGRYWLAMMLLHEDFHQNGGGAS